MVMSLSDGRALRRHPSTGICLVFVNSLVPEELIDMAPNGTVISMAIIQIVTSVSAYGISDFFSSLFCTDSKVAGAKTACKMEL